MRTSFMQAEQLEPFAHFLDEHPGFSPMLTGENALVCGFQVGGCFLRIDEMERLVAIRPPSGARTGERALLLSTPAWICRRQQ